MHRWACNPMLAPRCQGPPCTTVSVAWTATATDGQTKATRSQRRRRNTTTPTVMATAMPSTGSRATVAPTRRARQTKPCTAVLTATTTGGLTRWMLTPMTFAFGLTRTKTVMRISPAPTFPTTVRRCTGPPPRTPSAASIRTATDGQTPPMITPRTRANRALERSLETP